MLRTRVRAGLSAGVLVSVLFAALLVAVQSFDLFVDTWAPRFGAPTAVAIRVPYGARIVQSRSGWHVAYEHGRVLIAPGTVLSESDDEHRAAVAYESIRRGARTSRMWALGVIDFALASMLAAYLRRFGQNRMRLLRTQIGVFALLLLLLAAVRSMLLFTGVPEFWVPVAAVPLWVALSFDRRTAFLVNLVAAFFAASFVRFDLVFLTVLLVRGMAASLLFFDRKRPRQMLPAGALAGLFACGLVVAIYIVFEGRFDVVRDLSSPLSSLLLATIGGGVVGGLCAVVLRDPAERLLGVVSRDKLLDLTDLEQPLLKKMAREAPGSWEHARAMANLAEAAASAIGADALLTRVGAYYHDLGKTVQPKYFVENLAHGERSPHEDLDPDVSADAIMAHVVLGTKILRDGGVPEPVVEFCYTHHGTQVVEYFWQKCLDQGNPKGLSEDYFRYPGMKPQTKETAILMLVDSIEAASRTVEPPEREKFEEMIQRVLFTKLRSGQLDDCALTVEDLRTLVTRMSDTLVNVYHHRIRYPWQERRATSSPLGTGPAQSSPLPTPPEPSGPADAGPRSERPSRKAE